LYHLQRKGDGKGCLLEGKKKRGLGYCHWKEGGLQEKGKKKNPLAGRSGGREKRVVEKEKGRCSFGIRREGESSFRQKRKPVPQGA